MPVSLFNEVIGPIMRGPSSGHTAATWRMGAMSAGLVKSRMCTVECRFHKSGAYANVYRQQGSDTAFAAGLAGIAMTDGRYPQALDIAARQLELTFTTPELSNAAHPNEVEVVVASAGCRPLCCRFRSLGGGVVELVRLDGFSVSCTGDSHSVFCVTEKEHAPALLAALQDAGATLRLDEQKAQVLIHASFTRSPPAALLNVESLPAPVQELYTLAPLMFVPRITAKDPLLAKMEATVPHGTLAELAATHECELLGITRAEADAHLAKCMRIMLAACTPVRQDAGSGLRVAKPQAEMLLAALDQGAALCGGIHAKAAALATAAAERNAAGGLVVAAPTAGSGGVLPAMLTILKEDFGLTDEGLVSALWTAGAIGVAIAETYTFAGGVGGCQVEIGSAGAMAAAALVETAVLRSGKTASRAKALNAASLFLQNSIGLACDPVQGFVEVPCIGRNAAAISQAMVCADLALAGWTGPVSFSHTLLALKDAGSRLPPELRCTARGGLAAVCGACT
ncbi:L-serine ammonia-lyase, iron-sulfur-dependent, subunit alpha [Desulfovibrio sp. OttesenSCG-928-G15]|nr:L-serine ammonia-lyase, iron-sulfur-dependent, subunit alpha [Desulfovibrio sp. OttesenSCG-928-G15]